ncbi:MAG: hypothetical protein DCF23_07220 [Cyanobium sp.]|nr:MAG: hypothetical protein DCF23_07220 [Cyanobium sp.]
MHALEKHVTAVLLGPKLIGNFSLLLQDLLKAGLMIPYKFDMLSLSVSSNTFSKPFKEATCKWQLRKAIERLLHANANSSFKIKLWALA